MKQLVILLCVMSAMAWGQNGFNTLVPDTPVNILVHSDDVYVEGHWVPVDKDDKNSVMTGPSVSEINCTPKVCSEAQANIVAIGNTFTLHADNLEYTVERWNSKEIVAATVGGICRVRTVLKFYRVNKHVYWMQSLSEPTNDLPKMRKDLCNAVGMYLELKANTVFKR